MKIVIFGLPIVAAILFAVAGMIYGSQKTLSIWLVFAGVVLSALAICLYWQDSVSFDAEHPPFSVAIETALSGINRDATYIFCLYNPNRMSSVPVILFLRLVNLQNVPSRIRVLKIEVESKRGKWIFPSTWMPTKEIPDEMPLIWLNLPTTAARQLDLIGPRLEPILENGPIAPHDTASGWVLLSVPAEYDSAPRPLRFRITVKDTAGQMFTMIDSGPTGEENVLSSRGITTGKEVDVRGFSISHYFFK